MNTKNILIALITFIFSTFIASATDFGAGPDVYARAYGRVHHGNYQVHGSGLKEGFYTGFDYSSGVRNEEELMAPLKTAYVLRFENYKTDVYESAQICDENGNSVFISNMSWKPLESLSSDGETLSYQMPEYAGSIWLHLADQYIESDADFVQVELKYGYTIDLQIQDGQVIVPGWVYEQNGAFIEWKNGVRTVTDIQTGLPVFGGKEILETRASGVSGITVRKVSGLYLSIYSSQDWNTTFESVAQEDGVLNIWIGDSYGNSPEGVWITNVGTGLPTEYTHPEKGGYIRYEVKKGETLHIVVRWSSSTGKG